MPPNTPTEASAPASDEASNADSVNRSLMRVKAQLDELESQVDAYDAGISELSLELGTYYAEIERYDLALEALRRALHISRINYGLNSERQLPILERIHSIYTDVGQLEDAGQVLEKMLLVYQENYDPWSPALADIYERIGIWHLSAYYYGMDRQPVAHLVEAHSALNKAHLIDQYQSDGKSYDFDLYNLLAMTNWGLSTFYQEQDSSSELESLQMRSAGASTLISNAYRTGRSLLEEGIEVARQTGDPENLARAKLMYGDWHQMFNKRHTAREHYFEAFEITAQLDDDHPLKEAFALPHPLPNFDVRVFGKDRAEENSLPVKLHYDVDAWGNSKNVKLLNEIPVEEEVTETSAAGTDAPGTSLDNETSAEAELDNASLRAAIRAVRSSIYRPAMPNGQPIDFDGVTQTIMVAQD